MADIAVPEGKKELRKDATAYEKGTDPRIPRTEPQPNAQIVGQTASRKNLKLTQGPSRKAQGMGYWFVVMCMGLLLGGTWLLTGGWEPVDQSGPGGPPTLVPYFNAADYGQQRIITPTGIGIHPNLQLQTFQVLDCSNPDIVVEFLLDTSGSMNWYGKIGKLKAAMNDFLGYLPGLSGIGIITFSDQVQELVPLNYYKVNKAQVKQAVNNLSPSGWTVTRDGMLLAKQRIEESMNAKQFPNYTYILVLITDGVPEVPQTTIPDTRQCEAKFPDPAEAPSLRCFAQIEDPRIPTDLGAQLQMEGVTIYTIGITGPQESPSIPGSSDYLMQPYLSAMLTDESSNIKSQHALLTLNGDALDVFLNSILFTICKTPFNEIVTNTPTPRP